MDILVIGSESNLKEVREKFGDSHQYTIEFDHESAERFVKNSQIVFDFNLEEDPLQVEIYASTNAIVFINTTKVTLAELSNLSNYHLSDNIFGFNGLPSFLKNEVMEVSSLVKESEKLSAICDQLGTKHLLVEDRVGMVTPRVICMIINEAYFTVQEGTASKEDIDKAMKLGTNYPYGPFEWASMIGLNNIYEILEAVYNDTRDERYKIASLLKKEYLLLYSN